MKKKAFIYIILAGILWGTSGIFVHLLEPFGLASLQMTSIRGVVSAICMVIYILLHNKQLFKVKIKELVLFGFSGVGIYLTAAFYYAAMMKTTVSTAVVLMYTAPVLVMLFSVAFLGEKLNALKAIAVFLMLAGCVLVSGIIGGAKFETIGIILGLLSSVAYSAYNIVTKISMKQKCNPLSASMYCFIFMAIISLFFAKPLQIIQVAIEQPISIIIMIGLGICTCVLPYFLYTLSLKVLPAGTASSLAIVEPMSATIFSVALLGERLSVYSLAGVVLILGAVFMLSKGES